MTSLSKADWTGATGQTYEYSIYYLKVSLKEKLDGNYIFARQVSGGWEAVYIGEGVLNDRHADHLNNGCVVTKGATHFHCRLNSNAQSRRAEEVDLLGYNDEAYVPTGCNKKEGG